MAKGRRKARPDEALQRLERIKKLAVVAMFSEDELLRHLVLKGGNALDLIHKISTRASVDIDFSMANDFPGGQPAFRKLVEKGLSDTFAAEGYEVFDIKLLEQPEHLSKEIADFWGGYSVEFKLIERARYAELRDDIDALRRNAINLGGSTRLLIDVSKYEYVEGKQPLDFEGYRIFVYSVQMMVCEKLRAICQQLPEYGPIVKRERAGAPRARDFVDIKALMQTFGVDLTRPENQELLRAIFEAKRVPLRFLGLLGTQREFHRQDFPAVEATVKGGVVLESFDAYFDFTLELAARLKPLWNM